MGFLHFSRSDPFEVTFFRVAKPILRFLGIWPMDPFNRTTAIKVFINLSVLLVTILGEIRYSWLIRKHLVKALDAICPSLTMIPTWIKIACFLKYRNELMKLISGLQKHLRADISNSCKNTLIANISYFATAWGLFLYFFGVSTDSVYTTKPIISWAYGHFTGANGTWVDLPFQTALPYEDMTQVQSKTLYTLLYCFLAWSGVVTIFGFSGVDGAFMCCCMYISVAFKCLQEDFKNAFNKHAQRGLELEENELLYMDLKALAKRQQSIMTMLKRFNYIYRYMIFAHIVSAAITLGITLINLLLVPGPDKILYVLYTGGDLSQAFTYCYGVESIEESCSQTYRYLYFCDWYKCDKRVRKLVLFIITNAGSKSLVKVPFFSPSIPLFAAIVKTSFSYITLLREFI